MMPGTQNKKRFGIVLSAKKIRNYSFGMLEGCQKYALAINMCEAFAAKGGDCVVGHGMYLSL
jgi:hypothetical protein